MMSHWKSLLVLVVVVGGWLFSEQEAAPFVPTSMKYVSSEQEAAPMAAPFVPTLINYVSSEQEAAPMAALFVPTSINYVSQEPPQVPERRRPVTDNLSHLKSQLPMDGGARSRQLEATRQAQLKHDRAIATHNRFNPGDKILTGPAFRALAAQEQGTAQPTAYERRVSEQQQDWRRISSKETYVIESQAETKEVTVYGTNTGSKYHTASCHHLKNSKIPMSLEEAKKSYSACSVCDPPK